MKVAIITVDVLTVVLLFSTIVCGIWIANQPMVEASSIRFHLIIGISSAVVAAIALLIASYYALRAGHSS